jgi:MarR family transcriptional regulator for hemolysin
MSIEFWYGAGMRPDVEPLGLELARTGRLLSRAFNDALAAAGGSLPQWLVLVQLKAGHHATQRDLAAAVGVEGATLTHHLHRMEADGLIRRERVATDRRTQAVALTPAGEDAFATLLGAVQRFDRRLRAGIGAAEADRLRALLARLRANVADAETETDADADGSDSGAT